MCAQVGSPLDAEDLDAGDSVTFALTSDPSGFYALSQSGQLSTTKTLPATGGSTVIHTLTVTATDNNGAPKSHTVDVTLVDLNDPPVYLNAAFDVPENSGVNFPVGQPHTATDPDTTDVLSYSIVAGNTGGAFKIDSVTGQISVANPILDREAAQG